MSYLLFQWNSIWQELKIVTVYLHENEEMIVAVNVIYAIAWRSLKKIQDFNGVWTRDLAITSAMLYQLSYEATDVGSRSIVGSYVPVKEMSVI